MPDSFEHTPTVDDAHAERRAGVARRQRRSASPCRDRRSRPGPVACRATVERLVARAPAGHRRPVGHDVSAGDRVQDRRAHQGAQARGHASSSGGYDPSLAPDAYEDRRAASTSSSAAKASITFRELLRALEAQASDVEHDSPGLSCRSRRSRLRPQSPSARSARLDGDAVRPAESRRARADRLHAARPSGRRRRDVARAARSTAASARSSRCAGRNFHTCPIDRVLADIADATARGARAIFLVDDNITLERRALRGAVPGDHRRRLQRHRLHRPGR